MKSKKNNRVNLALFIAAMNGWTVFSFAIVCTAIAIPFGSISGGAIGLALSASGFMEIKGRHQLKLRQDNATTLLAGSQLLFFMSILFYSLYQLATFDAQSIIKYIPKEYYDLVLMDVYGTEEAFGKMVQMMHRVIYIVVIVGSLIYQGGLLVFYKVATIRAYK